MTFHVPASFDLHVSSLRLKERDQGGMPSFEPNGSSSISPWTFEIVMRIAGMSRYIVSEANKGVLLNTC